MEQKEKNQLFSAAISEYFADQMLDVDSAAYSFVSTLALTLVMENLSEKQRQEFTAMLEKEDYESLAPFIYENIPDFGQKLAVRARKEFEKISQLEQ